ncbi:MAG: DUF5693 family protein [Oscillospiraceae bacterium]|nr:DUF5693 family protein [Oscillospiraceae bacterium]
MEVAANINGKKRQPLLVWLATIIIVISLLCGIWVNFSIRAPVEANDKTVSLLVDYDELQRIAVATPGVELSDMLRKAYLAGATGIIVRERLLGEWEAAGDVLVYSGGQLKFFVENGFASPIFDESFEQGENQTWSFEYPYEDTSAGDTAGTVQYPVGDLNINPSMTYILTKDQSVFEQLFSLLEAKLRHPEIFEIFGYKTIAVQLHSIERSTLGLGFPLSSLEEAATAGFEIVLRLRNWEPLTTEGLNVVMNWLSLTPNLAAVGFNDQTVPGGGDNPDIQDRLAEALENLNVPLVSFEFYDQTGLSGLAGRLDNNLLRAHAIAENELRRYTDFNTAMNRYSLAATERNMRYIFLRFHGLNNPQSAMEPALELIAGVREGLESDGLTIGNPVPLESYKIPRILIFFLGNGVLVAGAWLLALAAKPFAKKKWHLPYGILVAFGFAAWAALMILAPTLSRKLMALAGAIVFPSLSVTLALMYKPEAQLTASKGKRLLRTIAVLTMASAMTFVGSMIMSGLLAEPTFMLKIDSFFGVKVSHLIPLVLVPGLLWLREENWFGIMSGTVRSNVKIWHLAVGGVLLVGMVIYILRTGNESPELISQLEVQIRQVLDNLLGVRPRTKEFLIGHPIMMVLVYYGYKLEMFPFVMVGLIGQISIISTYAHLHTPLAISLLRTFNGLWIGIILGIIAILFIEWMLGKLRKLYIEHGQGSRT